MNKDKSTQLLYMHSLDWNFSTSFADEERCPFCTGQQKFYWDPLISPLIYHITYFNIKYLTEKRSLHAKRI